MNVKTLSIKLTIGSLLSLGCLSGGLSARAQVVADRDTASSFELEGDAHYNPTQIACNCPNSEHPNPLSDFGQDLLATAILVTQQVDDPYQKTTLLRQIAQRYVQADQLDLATDFLVQARDAAETMENGYVQGQERITIAKLYGQTLNNTQEMDRIIQQTIEAIGLDEDNLLDRDNLLAIITDAYAESGRYEKAREFFDGISNPHTQTDVLYSLFYILEGLGGNDEESGSPEDVARFQQSFPEVETIFDTASSANPRSIEFQSQDDPLMSFVLGLYENPLQDSLSPQQAVESLIASKLPLIEALPEPVMQAYGYAYFGLHLVASPVPEQALPFFDLAQAHAERLESLPPANAEERTLYSFHINYLIATGLFELGEVEKGIGLIRAIENTPERSYDKIQSLFYVVEKARQPDFLQQLEQYIPLGELMADAEQAITSLSEADEREYYLIVIANAYASANDTDNARRIAQQLLAGLAEGPADNEPSSEYTKQQIVRLLSQIGDFEQALELAYTLDRQFLLASLSAQLIGEGHEDLAWEALESISSRTEQAGAMVEIARQYQMQGRAEEAWTVAARALALAESDDLFTAIDYASFSAEQTAELQTVERQRIVALVLSLYKNVEDETTAPEELERLVEQILDDGLRAYAALQFLPVEKALTAIGDLSPLRGRDDVLTLVVRETASGNLYEQSVIAIELMESPRLQAAALIDLATRDLQDLPAVSVGDRAAILESIRQRYRVAQP